MPIRSVTILLLFCCSRAFGDTSREVVSSVFRRQTSTPTTEELTFFLARSGELKIANANLTDDAVELAASTSVLLDGASVLAPFSLPVGTEYVVKLNSGMHTVLATLRGKPGGALRITASEAVASAGVGYELLLDGTVLQRSTGLIWHRDPCSPGPFPGTGNIVGTVSVHKSFLFLSSTGLTRDEYIAALNGGQWGTHSTSGNAGHSDWRVPTIKELVTLIDYRFSNPAMSDSSGQGTFYPAPWFGEHGGHQFAQPFFWCDINAVGCPDDTGCPWPVYPACTGRYASSMAYPSLTVTDYAGLYPEPMVVDAWSVAFRHGQTNTDFAGCVWPVRGPVQ